MHYSWRSRGVPEPATPVPRPGSRGPSWQGWTHVASCTNREGCASWGPWAELAGMNTRHELYEPWELPELRAMGRAGRDDHTSRAIRTVRAARAEGRGPSWQGRSHVTSYTHRESCASWGPWAELAGTITRHELYEPWELRELRAVGRAGRDQHTSQAIRTVRAARAEAVGRAGRDEHASRAVLTVRAARAGRPALQDWPHVRGTRGLGNNNGDNRADGMRGLWNDLSLSCPDSTGGVLVSWNCNIK